MDKLTIADTTIVFCDGGLYVMKKMSGVNVCAQNPVKPVGSHNEVCEHFNFDRFKPFLQERYADDPLNPYLYNNADD